LKLTSNALVTLVKAEQDCFKELSEAVDITRRISEFIWQWVPARNTRNARNTKSSYKSAKTWDPFQLRQYNAR